MMISILKVNWTSWKARQTPPDSVSEKPASRVKKQKRDGEEPRPKRARLHAEAVREIPCVLRPNNLDYFLPGSPGCLPPV